MTSPAPPRLIDVAKAAGVSRGTASNVFAHPELVRQELRDRVEQAARELGYAGPDPRGRLLRAGRFNTIGYLLNGAYGLRRLIESPFGRELVLGIAEGCDAAGVALTLIDGQHDRVGKAMRDALVDGFIVGHTGDLALVEPARQRRLPFVMTDTTSGKEINSVNIDAAGGAREAARHLAGLGHTRFAVVSVRRTPGPAIVHPTGRKNRRLEDGFPLDREKLRGFGQGLAEFGLSLADAPIVETVPWDIDTAAAVRAAAPDATAIFVMSDRHASRMLIEFARMKIRVPRDVSIVGFDDVPESAHTTPPLTTVRQPTREKGRLAVEMLLAGGPPRQLVLPVELIVRASTAPPPPLARRRQSS